MCMMYCWCFCNPWKNALKPDNVQVEWAGWAVAAYPSLPAVAFAVFTFSNLAPRGWRHHLWYAKCARAREEGFGGGP